MKKVLALLSVGIVTFSPTYVLAKEAMPSISAPATFADLAAQLSPAVVNIASTQKAEVIDDATPEFPEFPPGSPFEDFFEEFMGKPNGHGAPVQRAPMSSLGSGFIIDADKGYIITNNHVIKDAEEVRVTLHDDSTLEAKIIGRDEKVDLAVLQVKTDKKLTAVSFGDSDAMRVGDWVLAIGNPFGLGGTVTAGIISARQRDINSGPYDDYLQTDASINRGNSGGPMFNTKGEVIGINTAIFSPSGGSVGIGFAVPSNLAKPVVKQLIEYGRTRRGWLGVRIQTVTDEIAESLGLDKAHGALIASVTKGGPAEKAKLKAGDIITEFNGKPIHEMRELPRIVAETPIGEKTTLKYWRNGKEYSATVKVGELEKAEEDGLLASDTSGTKGKASGTNIDIVGMHVSSITDALRNLYNIDQDVTGVLVTKVDPRGEAASKGIDSGDIIVEINQQSVSSAKDVQDAIEKAQKDKRSSILLLVNHDGDVRFVALKLDEDE